MHAAVHQLQLPAMHDPVEMRHGPPRVKAPSARRETIMARKVRQTPPIGAPFVEIAHQQRRMRRVALDGRENSPHLLAPLAGAQSEVCRDDAQRCGQTHVDTDVERTARLVPADAEVEMVDRGHRVARQHGIPEIVPVALAQHAGDDVKSRCALEIAQKRRVLLLGRDFLQRDDVGADFPEHVDDARGRVAAVGADGAVDVPGRGLQRPGARRVTCMRGDRGFSCHESAPARKARGCATVFAA